MGQARAGQTHGWVSGAVSTALKRNTGCRTSERPSGMLALTQSTHGGVCRGRLQVAVLHPAAVGRLTAMAVYLHATVHAEGGWPERSEALGQSRGSTRRRRTGQQRTDQWVARENCLRKRRSLKDEAGATGAAAGPVGAAA